MSDIFLDPDGTSFAVSEVVTASKLQSYVLDNMKSVANGLVGDGSADSDIKHAHKTGTLVARPAASLAGRLYYATDLGVTFLDDGTRWDAIAINHRICDQFFDDFWWNASVPSTWDNVSSGGNIVAAPGVDSVLGMDTTTTITRRAGIGDPNALFGAWDITRIPAIWQCRVKVGSASRINEEIFIGLMGPVATTVGSDLDTDTKKRIGFQKSDAGAEADWNSVTCDAAVVKNPITGFQNGSFHLFEIIVRTASAIDFYIDGALKFTHTTQIPTTTLRQVLYIDNTAAAQKFLYPDHVEFLSKRI